MTAVSLPQFKIFNSGNSSVLSFFSISHCIVCPSQFTASDYHFGTKIYLPLFLKRKVVYYNLKYLIVEVVHACANKIKASRLPYNKTIRIKLYKANYN